jgi:type VI protein secretion system component VasF
LNAAYDVLSNPEYRARYDLDRTRLRRSESLRYAATAPSPTRSVGSSLATRHAAATREQRVSRITGQVVLALIVAVLVATMLFFLVLMALDSTADDMPTRSGQPPSQLVQR